MPDDMERDASGESSWDLDELDNLFDDFFSKEESSEKSVSQLYDEAWELYRQARHDEAAAIFHQAAELAERQGDIEEQCKELYWEGECYRSNTQLYKALNCFLEAEKVRGFNQIYQCYNLADIFDVSLLIPLPLPQLLILLDRLKPYQTRQQVGGSRSMALLEEYDLLYNCGRYAEALARAQEGFVSLVKEMPYYNDNTYFSRLTDAYRLNGRFSDAWDTLRRWRAEGSFKYARTKSRQLHKEGKLLYTEGKVSDAWDTLLQGYREERIIGRAGREIDTLRWLIRVGAELGRFDDIFLYLRQILRFRNSDSMFKRFYCREAWARYFLALCASGTLTAAELVQARRHVSFWLEGRGDCPGARTLARELDSLLSMESDVCVKWTSRVEAMETRYRAGRNRL